MAKKRGNPFLYNQVDCLPILEFIEKYPDVTFKQRYQTFLEIGFNCVNQECGLIASHLVWWKEWGRPDSNHIDFAGYNSVGKLTMLTIDHIYPRSKGGPNEIWNYQPMCAPCNSKKADKILTNDKPKWRNGRPPDKNPKDLSF